MNSWPKSRARVDNQMVDLLEKACRRLIIQLTGNDQLFIFALVNDVIALTRRYPPGCDVIS